MTITSGGIFLPYTFFVPWRISSNNNQNNNNNAIGRVNQNKRQAPAASKNRNPYKYFDMLIQICILMISLPSAGTHLSDTFLL